ncbi:MAG: hypothetical protein KI790_05145 [Cyclobacteriaceae bacterium]|nr:hypothetical protein [Cyclobacteriaceae bacterium HetDA_MAG_MS6]
MRKITALALAFGLFLMYACSDDDGDVDDLKKEVEDLIDLIEDETTGDSLRFVLAMDSLEYRKFVDSLARVDSIAFTAGKELPLAYTVLVYDGSNTSVTGFEDSRSEGFSTDVTISISQYGQTRSITTQDGLASFDNVGFGILQGSVSADGYTTFEWSTETVPDVDDESYGDISTNDDFLVFLNEGSFGHAFAIFSTTGSNTSTLTGRVNIETDLTNPGKELAPEGTNFLALIDTDNFTFRERYVQNSDQNFFADNIISYGYSPVFQAAVDASGNYSFNLPAAADGLPIELEYSDVVADQTYFLQTNGDVTEETVSTVFGPQVAETFVPNITLAPDVSFEAGGGAEARVTIDGTGTITDINLESGGQDYQGTPRVFISAPPAGGTQATATATVTNGVVTDVTLTDGGSGYTSDPSIQITEGRNASAIVTSLLSSGGNGGVAEVLVDDGGQDFASAPNVLFSFSAFLDSAGVADFNAQTDATNAVAVLNTNGSVADINVTNTGSDLDPANTTPFVFVTSGINAVAEITAVDVNGGITGITILNSGDFYTDVPNVVPQGGVTGIDATFSGITVVNGEIATIAASGGQGYGVGQRFNLEGVGNGAAASAIREGLSIETIDITNEGTEESDGIYYSNVPLVVIDEPDFNGPGSAQATATAILGVEGRLAGINITNVGSGYYGTPGITIVSGNGAFADAEFDQQRISGFEIDDEGAGYLAAPGIIIVDDSGNGTGATATANLTDGRVTSIDVTNAGTGYVSPGNVRVIFLDPGLSYNPDTRNLYNNPAEADIEVTDGVITAITMTSAGDNYNAAPAVIIDAVKGSGFAATATVSGGRVTQVTVDQGGQGYVNGNTPGSTQTFSGSGNYTSYSGITRVQDVNYGTGQRRD